MEQTSVAQTDHSRGPVGEVAGRGFGIFWKK